MVTTLSVTDLTANRVVWVERFETQMDNGDLIEDTQTMAQQIVHKLVKPAGIILVKALQKRMGVHPNNWTATDCILRWHYYRLLDRSPGTHASLRAKIKRIIDIDPMFPLGKIIYAMLKLDEAVYLLNPTSDADSAISRAQYYIQQAISADPEIPGGHYVSAQCNYFANNLEGFRTSAQESLSRNPRNPRNSDLLHHIGVFLALSGDSEQGLNLAEQAGMGYHSGVGYRLGHILISYFWEEPGAAKALFETCMMPNQLSIGQLAGCLAYLRADEIELAAERFHKLHELEGVSSRAVEQVVDLGVKDPTLKAHIMNDLSRLKATSSTVVPLSLHNLPCPTVTNLFLCSATL